MGLTTREHLSQMKELILNRMEDIRLELSSLSSQGWEKIGPHLLEQEHQLIEQYLKIERTEMSINDEDNT